MTTMETACHTCRGRGVVALCGRHFGEDGCTGCDRGLYCPTCAGSGVNNETVTNAEDSGSQRVFRPEHVGEAPPTPAEIAALKGQLARSDKWNDDDSDPGPAD
jgi:hypothetical protein